MNTYNFKHKQRLNKIRNHARLKDRKRRIKNKKRKYMLYYIFFAIIILSLSTILSLTVFFKIELIEIKSSSKKFTPKLILNKINLNYGDNLILLNMNKLLDNIINNFPSLNDATVKKTFPNKVQIVCDFSGPIFVLETKNHNLLGLSKSGRIVKKYDDEKQCKNLMHLKIYTPSFENYQLGQFIKMPKQEKQILNALIHAIQKTNLKNITKIEITPNCEIIITYDDRIEIEIKNLTHMEKIIKNSDKIIADYIGKYEKCKICYFEKNNTTHVIPIIEKNTDDDI